MGRKEIFPPKIFCNEICSRASNEQEDEKMEDFDEIYQTYARPLYLYVLRLSQSEMIAEEIVQETFYKAVKNARKFKGECKILTWLCQIAKNEYLGFLRKKENAHLNIDDYQALSDMREIEKIVEDHEAATAVLSILRTISDPYRRVFELRVIDALSFQEISDLFGKSENWARVTFYRAKQKITEKAREQGYEV